MRNGISFLSIVNSGALVLFLVACASLYFAPRSEGTRGLASEKPPVAETSR